MKIYNTLTRRKEDFQTIEEKKVKMYSCGPTVYNYFHLGNARPFVVFDLMRRYLEYRGYEVTFVQNFTDVDDKMIRRAKEEGKSLRELADEYIREYFVDADALGIRRATIQPRATETMEAIIEQIQALLDRGHAYIAEDGIYFETRSFDDYGKLSRFHLEELEAGASERVTGNEQKKDPADFALWKFRKEDEPYWDSPWGEGRPGWHIECSSMIHRYLGETIDLHCGGQDLMFPHHENEIAQSECACGKPFAHYWMHNGFINVDGEKMSKSLGNFFTVRDVAQHFPYAVIRYFLLTGHYRSPINFSDQLLASAASSLERIQNCYQALRFYLDARQEKANGDGDASFLASLEASRSAFIAAMDDDLNTPDALAVIFTLVRELNLALQEQQVSLPALRQGLQTLEELLDVLGIEKEPQGEAIPAEVQAWLEERSEAKKARDFATADALRDKIREAGYKILDTPEGSRLEKI